MIEEFQSQLRNKCGCSPDDRILLAVSGGVDSMVMTHLFYRLGTDFGIAHCNFGLRGDESDGDEDFVRDWANARNVAFFSKRFNTNDYAIANGISTQMAARDLRYSWFEEIRSKNNYSFIALAHNLNDNIETFLINLVRGTGITGLSGIKPNSGSLIRPLLPFAREEILSYKEEYEVPHREDSSNATTKYIRNNIRHRIIPLLTEINPSIDNTLSSTIGILNDIGEIYFDHVEKLRKKHLKPSNNGFTIKIKALNSLLDNRSVAFELLRPFGINRSQLDDLAAFAGDSSGKMVITDSFRLIGDREFVIIEPIVAAITKTVRINDAASLRGLPFIANVEILDNHGAYQPPQTDRGASFDSDLITFPIEIRPWRKGDHFYPLGMKGKKKLSDFFIDNKLSILEKERVRIMEVDGKIAWIIGHRIDERFRVTDETRQIIIFTLQ